MQSANSGFFLSHSGAIFTSILAYTFRYKRLMIGPEPWNSELRKNSCVCYVVTRSTSPPGKYWAPSPAFSHWKLLHSDMCNKIVLNVLIFSVESSPITFVFLSSSYSCFPFQGTLSRWHNNEEEEVEHSAFRRHFVRILFCRCRPLAFIFIQLQFLPASLSQVISSVGGKKLKEAIVASIYFSQPSRSLSFSFSPLPHTTSAFTNYYPYASNPSDRSRGGGTGNIYYDSWAQGNMIRPILGDRPGMSGMMDQYDYAGWLRRVWEICYHSQRINILQLHCSWSWVRLFSIV